MPGLALWVILPKMCPSPANPITQPFTRKPLSYTGRLEARSLGEIDLVVIHCTELPDLAMAREYGERILYPQSRTGNSGHYYIDRDGTAEEWVEPARVAHHTRGFNPRSLGIELVNRGRWPNWFDSGCQEMAETYPPAQIDALCSLLSILAEEMPGLRWIAGHEELDTDRVPASDDPALSVCRKRDPGPLFPWEEVLSASRLEPLAR